MPAHRIEELAGGEAIHGTYLLQQIEIRSARTGSLYLVMKLADRTGSIDARRWDATDVLYQRLREASFVEVRGRVEAYRDALQIIADDVRPVDAPPDGLAAFLPETDKDVDQMMEQLNAAINAMTNEPLRALLRSFFDDEEFAQKFKQAPAAVSYHHPFLGGLLEHVCSVLWVTEQIVGHYDELDRDLLVAGIIFHDIGKVRELSVGAGFRYSDEGELLGHISIGILMVQERAAMIEGFPPELLMEIQHLILSHHGELEYGSPKVPMTIEAIALHHLENLDAKINAFSMALKADRPKGDAWTSYNRMFRRRLYKRL